MITSTRQNRSPMLSVHLWERTGASGNTYLIGRLDAAHVFAMANSDQQTGSATHVLMLGRNWRERGRVMMDPLDCLRLQCGAEHLTLLRPHAIAELLAEVTQYIRDGSCILDLLAQYERPTPHLLQATGSELFLPRPLHVVSV